MERILGPYAPLLFAVLRIVAGVMFTMHGTQKIFGFPGEKETVELFSLMGIAGIIELVAGIMITLGLFAGIAAFIASGEMAVAYFKAHAPQGALPILNEGELAVLYCFLFLFIAAYGAGPLSIDAAIKKKK